MLSRRVYEILASGTPVVSTPSPAIIEQFGNAVTTVETERQAIKEVTRLVGDKLYWSQQSHLGYRHVMQGNTYKDRTDQILSEALNKPMSTKDTLVSIVTPTKQPNDYVKIIENVFAQNYPAIELVVGFGGLYSERDVNAFIKKFEIMQKKSGKGISLKFIHFTDQVSLGYKLNTLIHEANGEIIAKMDDDDHYLENYISDMVLPLRWGEFDLVGKWATFWHDVEENQYFLKNPNGSHKETDLVFGATLVAPRNLFLKNPFQERVTGEDTFLLAQFKSNGLKIYSSDPYNFCVSRRKESHTWQTPDNFWERDCIKLSSDFSLSEIGI